MTTVDQVCEFIAEEIAESPARIRKIYDDIMYEQQDGITLADLVDEIVYRVKGTVH